MVVAGSNSCVINVDRYTNTCVLLFLGNKLKGEAFAMVQQVLLPVGNLLITHFTQGMTAVAPA